MTNNLHILSLLIFLPLVGAFLSGLWGNPQSTKKIALGFAGAELLLAVFVLRLFQSSNGDFQLLEQAVLLPSLNVEFLLGIDGISVLFLPLSALLSIMVILASWRSVQSNFTLLLVLQSMTIGVLTALDLMLFFLFWLLTLVPLFFLISMGGVRQRSAAIKYAVIMLVSSLPLLAAILLLAFNHATAVDGIAQNLSFSLPLLLATQLPDNLQNMVFFLLLLSFAIRTPLVPFHTWLPMLAMESSAHITALLVGLNLGVYGLLRLAMPLASSVAVQYSWALGILGAITLIYGALLALQQSNLRRLLAYLSISQIGLVIIGISTLNLQGLQGAIFQLLNFTVVASSLMLLSGFIRYRLGSTEALQLGGLIKTMPRLSCFYFIFLLASVGMPLTSSFPAELLIVIGALTAHSTLGITALAGIILSVCAMLSFTRRAFFGTISSSPVWQKQDLRPRELALLGIPVLLILLFGFMPNKLMKINYKSSELWLTRLIEQPAMGTNK
jgi:NADH-quinone oxidoreductase subunit M